MTFDIMDADGMGSLDIQEVLSESEPQKNTNFLN
jgi:hypothetical protein